MSSAPGLIEIEDAYHRIESFIHKTPVMTSSALNKISNENSGQFFIAASYIPINKPTIY